MDNKELNTIEDIQKAIEYASLDMPGRIGLLDKVRLAVLRLKASGVLISPTYDAIQAQIMRLLFPQEARLTNRMFLVDEFGNSPAEAIRLFEFGEIWKDGKHRDFTREFAEQMTLPHYTPAIKLGSHNDETKSGGVIKALEVREDGLYGIPEYNENGQEAIEQKHYNFHSPEVIWDGWMENPKTGEPIEGPLIVGLALLHDPHLGQSASLYSAVKPYTRKSEDHTEINIMTTEKLVEVPVGFFEKIEAMVEKFTSKKEEEPQEPREDFEAIQSERDDFKSKFEALKEKEEKANALAKVKELFSSTEHGKAFSEIGTVEANVDMLAGMTDEQQAWVTEQLKGLSAQADGITEEIGDLGDEAAKEPKDVLNAEVEKYASENKVDYNEALKVIRRTKPQLVRDAGIK